MHSPLRLRTLPAHERRLFLAALQIVIIARLGLWLLPLPQLQRFLSWLADATATAPAHADYAGRAAQAVQRASQVVPGATCLTQALATMTLLRRRGLVGRLRIGPHSDRAPSSRRHACVEFGGRVIIGATTPALPALPALTSLPGERR